VHTTADSTRQYTTVLAESNLDYSSNLSLASP